MSKTPEVVQAPIPEGIEEYGGRWVAIRGGQVLADAKSLRALMQDALVRPDDLLFLVPDGRIWIL